MTPVSVPVSEPNPAAEALLKAVHGNPIAMINCARTLLVANGDIERAREVCREALALAPDDAEAMALARPVLSYAIGSWYFTMVLDTRRHALYAEALERVLQNGGVVLDIGAGTGIFAMIAAKAGADHVFACESDPQVARAAREIIEKNGFADKITILPVDSRTLEVGRDMPERADVLLWDNLSNNFLGAGCAATLADAKDRLLKPGAPVLPGRTELLVAPVTDLYASYHSMYQVDGFDMSAFNMLRSNDFTLDKKKFELRSEPAILFDFDVSTKDRLHPERSSANVTLTEGRVDGIAQWLRFHLGEGLVYDTIDDDIYAFGTQFHVASTFEGKDGDQVTVHGAHDTLDTWFWLEK